jgi:nitrogen fixation-related uncharacterized protein
MSNATSPWQSRVTIIMALVILLPSMYGFIGKFIEFIHVFQVTPGGQFAVAPILNYLLASMGFFMLLLWACSNGMFSDMEQPKHSFLENEARLNERNHMPS